MMVNYSEFSDRFQRANPSPVYLFAGEERFFIDEGVRAVKARFLDKGASDFNYDVYSAAEVDASGVIDTADTLPVMAELRVILVKGVDEWKSGDKEVVASYLKRPSATTCLILTASKIDKREKFLSAVDKSGTVILCQPLYKDGIKRWVTKRIRNSGKNIDKDALDMLTEVAGNEMLTLNNDLDKLILYCNDQKTISIEDVKAVSSSMRSFSVFEVVNAIIEGRLKDAVFSLRRAIDDGEPPVRVFYFIFREFRMMLRAKTLIETGKPPEEAAKITGVPAFKVREFSHRLQKFSMKELFTVFEKLVDTDSRLKGSILKPGMVLEELLLFIYRMKFA